MSVLKVRPEFLYPRARHWPFDEVAEKIVRAIEARNWKVPGLTVEFDTYGSGEAKYQLVRSITGCNFKLYFSREQGCLPNQLNDTAAVREICIPKQILEVWEAWIASYYLYVGANWEQDKKWFMDSCKVNSKLNGEPRRYLHYTSAYSRRTPAVLLPFSDLGREYMLMEGDPEFINLMEKAREIATWLEKNVLEYILDYPEADAVESPTPKVELIPYEGPWNTIFSICNYQAAERIKTGMENPNDLAPYDRHASFGSMPRWIPLYVACRGRFTKIAYEGFIWCDVNLQGDTPDVSKFAPEIWSRMKSSLTNYMVAIKLKYANDVYVADAAAYDQKREEILNAVYPRGVLTDKEIDEAVDEAYAASGATIIPLGEYKGGYTQPVVLINRELDFDEIVWVTKIEKKKK